MEYISYTQDLCPLKEGVGDILKLTGSTGIKRRRKGLPRGTKMAPQGRPPKRKNEVQCVPFRKAKRAIKQHNLSQNIALNTRNAS